MTDHEYYEELTALSAGGHLSPEENVELRAHLEDCAQCRESVRVYRDLVIAALPLARDVESRDRAAETPADDARERLLARASQEGVSFSPEVETQPAAVRGWSAIRVVAALAIAATLLLAVFLSPRFFRSTSPDDASRQEVDRLAHENALLTARLTERDQEFSGQQQQLRKLRNELDAAAKTASDLRRDAQSGVRLGQSTSREAQLLEELENRNKQLASAADDMRRINQLRITDRAELEAQGKRLKDVFNQLRVATATIEVERQLASTGRDLLQLMLAKQLRVVDVRDTDANGRSGAAFARVFLAEGKSIRIFAFDLNDGGGPRRYQVWGEELGKAGSARSLGILDVDDRTQNRWSLTIQNAESLKSINSVFVTTAAGGQPPDGARLLYAYLGQSLVP